MTQSIRNLLRRRPLLEVAPQVWLHILEQAGSEAEAVARFEEALDRWAKKKPSLMPFLTQIAPWARSEPLVAFVGIWAARRWYGKTKDGIGGVMVLAQGVIMGMSDAATKVAPIQIRALELALPVIEAAPASLRIPSMVLMIREGYGMALAQDDDPVVKRRGLRVLDSVVADAESELELATEPDMVLVLGHMLSKAQANVAETIRQLVEDGAELEPIPALRRAVELLDRSVEHRAADHKNPVNFVHSLRMRGSVHRSLSMRVTDDASKLRHLSEAINDVQAAQRVVSMYPEGQFQEPADLRVNEINARCDLAEFRASNGDWSSSQAGAELDLLERMASELPDHLDHRGRNHQAVARSSIRFARQRLSGNALASTYKEVLGEAKVLVTSQQLNSRPKGIVAAEARNLLLTVIKLYPGANAEPEPIPVEDWAVWESLFSSLNVEVTGGPQIELAMVFEAELLGRELRRSAGCWDWTEYLARRTEALEHAMAAPTATAFEKHLYAAWLKRLVAAGLHIDKEHGCLRPWERLRLVDLGGAAAWRADLNFFGAGPTVEMSRLSEPGWRMDLYRARWERDFAAQVLAHERAAERFRHKLGEPEGARDSVSMSANRFRFEVVPADMPPELIEAKTGVPREKWQSGPDGIYVPRVLSDEDCRRELQTLADEIRDNIDYGAARGWLGPGFGTCPPVDADAVRRWLVDNSDTLVLTASVDGITVYWATDSGLTARSVELGSELAEPIAELELARQEYAYGPEDQASGVDWSKYDQLETTRAGWRPDGADLKGPTSGGASRLLAAVDALLAVLAGRLENLLEEALHDAIQRVVVLPRGWMRRVPWAALPLGEKVLVDRVDVAWLESLAEVPQPPARQRSGSILYVGQVDRVGADLGIGRASLGPLSDGVVGPLARDDFERVVADASVLRLYAHGQTILADSDASGFVLDADLDWGGVRYSNSEARLLDLQGASRVELWACESGVDSWMFRFSAEHDEPGGTDAAVLLAGAGCAVSSLWIQDALGTAMIAEAFALELNVDSNLDEAGALRRAVMRYRHATGPDGLFTQAVEAALQRTGTPGTLEELRLAGWNAWRIEAWTEIAGRNPPAVEPTGGVAPGTLGPVVPRRTLVGAGDALALRALVDEVMAPLRSKLVWAGWKVTFRSKSTLSRC
jgi:hypothetical protein